MSGITSNRFSRTLLFLFCLIGLAAVTGCGPNQVFSAADLQTCSETAAAVHDQFTFYVTPYDLKWKPWTITPGSFSISTPLNGSVYPFEGVPISFNQPPADPYVDFRKLDIFVTPFDSIQLTKINSFYNDFIVAKYPKFQFTWAPKSSGQFLIVVVLRNYRNGANTMYGSPLKDFGPASTAYVCVKIKPPSKADIIKQPVEAPPVGVFATFPTTQPGKPSDTPTRTPTLTETPTLTFTPTLTVARLTPTFTYTVKPPTATFTSRPPSATPTEVTASCSSYDNEDSCKAAGCDWFQPPVGGPGECREK